MSGNLLKKFVSHYPLSSQKPVMQSWIFCSLIGEFQVNSKGYKSCINLIFIHFHRKVVLWWREHISQSKFKDDIETLNSDDVLSVILKIERENDTKPNFNLKFDVFSNTFYLIVNWNIENIYSSYEDDIFLTQIKVRRRNNLAIIRMPF